MKTIQTRLLLIAASVVIALLVASSAITASAQSGNFWQVQYYSNPFLQGNPTFTTYTGFVAYNWGGAPPAPGMPAVNWSARLTTSAAFNGGLYRFTLTADDGFTLRLNNQIIASTIDAPQPGKTFTYDVVVNPGQNFVQVDYRQNSDAAYLYVNWGPSSGQPIFPFYPTATPRPPKPTPIGSLKTRYGDYTNCVRRKLHQASCFKSDGVWNSPDIGSIRSEPKIVVWYPCIAGSVLPQAITYGGQILTTQCSKTEAGYFVKP